MLRFCKARELLRKGRCEFYVGICKSKLVFCIYPFLGTQREKGFLNYPCFLKSKWGQLIGNLDSLTKS